MTMRALLLAAGLSALAGCQTWTEPMTLPSGKYLEHPPQYFPPTTLAVANVHKEDVSVFAVESGGLRFLRTVKAGEAADLPATPGQKLAATFAAAPHCANFTPTGAAGEVWLLRPAPRTPPAF